MKLSGYQKKQLADEIANVYTNFVGVEYGYFITPRERERLSNFALCLLPLLNTKQISVDYIKHCYKRTLKNFSDAVLCFVASLIVQDVLNIDFELVPVSG